MLQDIQTGLSTIEQPGDLIGVEAGAEIIILRIISIAFADLKEVHVGQSRGKSFEAPLRQLKVYVIGYLTRHRDDMQFQAHDGRLPTLGASAYPLSNQEIIATTRVPNASMEQIPLGTDSRNRSIKIHVPVNDFLGRHIAILGATGQGKTHFVAALLQHLAKFPNARIIVFDVNGEYADAFGDLGERMKHTSLGDGFKIPVLRPRAKRAGEVANAERPHPNASLTIRCGESKTCRS